MVQLSHPYMTTGKTIALIIWMFVDKAMSLLFNMLSSFVIAFLSWLQSQSAVILDPKKIKSELLQVLFLKLHAGLLGVCFIIIWGG